MIKKAIYILALFLITLTLTNCKSSKRGCGLTSDSQKIEQSTTVQTTIVREAK